MYIEALLIEAAAAAAAAGYSAAADTPDTTLTLWREMVHPFAPAMCKPVGGYAAGSRRREVTVPAAWPALALGAGQGSGLLLLLPLQENSAGSRSSPHSSSSLEAPLTL